ncbi:hypothetical protein ABKV19_014002 [Rosa sericea]
MDESPAHLLGSTKLFTQVSSFLALAVTVVAEVVKTMVAKGYVLGQDALIKGICQNNELGHDT